LHGLGPQRGARDERLASLRADRWDGAVDVDAVLAELFHLLGEDRRELTATWGLLRSGAITVLPIDDVDLPEVEALMKRYADRPMDFADATPVHLARRERLNTVFTVDHDDFDTYRIDGRKRFRIIPGRRENIIEGVS
jgi:predicted nucleic acid-binding protein